jgi:hypothetical protein
MGRKKKFLTRPIRVISVIRGYFLYVCPCFTSLIPMHSDS